jgi:chaperonin GroES
MAVKIRPLHDRVLVKRLEEQDGKVVPLDVKAGDRILFGKYAGSEIKLDGEEHLILREEDILGVVEG